MITLKKSVSINSTIRFLKKTILATLQEKGVVEKFHVKREPNTEDESQGAPSSLGKKKKKASNVPKHSWYWRIHGWEQSVAESKKKRQEQVEGRTAREASSKPSEPAKATA